MKLAMYTALLSLVGGCTAQVDSSEFTSQPLPAHTPNFFDCMQKQGCQAVYPCTAPTGQVCMALVYQGEQVEYYLCPVVPTCTPTVPEGITLTILSR